mgnify:CR=1 FL=1
MIKKIVILAILLLMFKLSIEDIRTRQVSKFGMYSVIFFAIVCKIVDLYNGKIFPEMELILILPGIILLLIGCVNKEVCGMGDGMALLAMGMMLSVAEYLRGIITLGRKPENTIVLTEPFVSGNHAKIYAKNNNLYVEDLNSTNGVYVNNERIQEKYKLVADDEVKIGSAIFKVLKSGR